MKSENGNLESQLRDEGLNPEEIEREAHGRFGTYRIACIQTFFFVEDDPALMGEELLLVFLDD